MYEYPFNDEKGNYCYRTIGGKRVKIYKHLGVSKSMKISNKFPSAKNNKKYYTKKLDSIVMAKYSRTKEKIMYVYDADYWYLVENNDFGEYTILVVLKIEGNEDIIKILSKEMDNDD